MDIIPRQDEPVSVNYPEDYDPSLDGIGGWLVLIIIGRFLSIVFGVKGIFDFSAYAGYDPQLDVLVYSSIVFDVLITIALSGVILFFIFKRNILFRTMIIIQMGICFLYVVILTIYTSSLGVAPDLAYNIVAFIESALWVLYLYKSKRVKNTYIYPKIYP